MSDFLASVDGVIAPPSESSVSITDEGLLRGDGAFEVARLYNGVPFAWDDHVSRLQRSADGLRLEFDLTALQREVTALLEETGPVDALLRIVLTRGGRRIAIIEPKPTPPPTATVATVTYAPNRILDTLKTLSYAGNMLAGRLAKEQGADEALFVSPHGRVLEGPTWTFFWVKDGTLLTPPLEDRILHSITRDRLMRCTDAEERVTTLDDLAGAEEAFIASSVREVLPISAIDGRALPSAPGPVTEAAAAAFREHVAACVSSPS
jgi:branched-chain amino acid aminotransferase